MKRCDEDCDEWCLWWFDGRHQRYTRHFYPCLTTCGLVVLATVSETMNNMVDIIIIANFKQETVRQEASLTKAAIQFGPIIDSNDYLSITTPNQNQTITTNKLRMWDEKSWGWVLEGQLCGQWILGPVWRTTTQLIDQLTYWIEMTGHKQHVRIEWYGAGEIGVKCCEWRVLMNIDDDQWLMSTTVSDEHVNQTLAWYDLRTFCSEHSLYKTINNMRYWLLPIKQGYWKETWQH